MHTTEAAFFIVGLIAGYVIREFDLVERFLFKFRSVRRWSRQ